MTPLILRFKLLIIKVPSGSVVVTLQLKKHSKS